MILRASISHCIILNIGISNAFKLVCWTSEIHYEVQLLKVEEHVNDLIEVLCIINVLCIKSEYQQELERNNNNIFF